MSNLDFLGSVPFRAGDFSLTGYECREAYRGITVIADSDIQWRVLFVPSKH